MLAFLWFFVSIFIYRYWKKKIVKRMSPTELTIRYKINEKRKKIDFKFLNLIRKVISFKKKSNPYSGSNLKKYLGYILKKLAAERILPYRLMHRVIYRPTEFQRLTFLREHPQEVHVATNRSLFGKYSKIYKRYGYRRFVSVIAQQVWRVRNRHPEGFTSIYKKKFNKAVRLKVKRRRYRWFIQVQKKFDFTFHVPMPDPYARIVKFLKLQPFLDKNDYKKIEEYKKKRWRMRKFAEYNFNPEKRKKANISDERMMEWRKEYREYQRSKMGKRSEH